jgi:hypothetical protein
MMGLLTAASINEQTDFLSTLRPYLKHDLVTLSLYSMHIQRANFKRFYLPVSAKLESIIKLLRFNLRTL